LGLRSLPFGQLAAHFSFELWLAMGDGLTQLVAVGLAHFFIWAVAGGAFPSSETEKKDPQLGGRGPTAVNYSISAPARI
jgi:hypothetical protein